MAVLHSGLPEAAKSLLVLLCLKSQIFWKRNHAFLLPEIWLQCLYAKQNMMICLSFYSLFDWVKSCRTLIEKKFKQLKMCQTDHVNNNDNMA